MEHMIYNCNLKPADLRYNAVVKQKYRKYYNRAVLNQLWNDEKLGFSIKQCIELGARIIQNEIRNVL